MKVLKFEGAGCVPRGNLENCRIRTTFTNDLGQEIYLEISGVNVHRNSPLHINEFHGFISHCFYTKDRSSNYSPKLAQLEEVAIEYDRDTILKFINRNLWTSFDGIQILNDGYDGFKNQDQ